MPETEDDATGREGSHDTERQRDLRELGQVYRDALAWDDWRARDRRLVRLRASLGAVLAALGWRPDDADAADMERSVRG